MDKHVAPCLVDSVLIGSCPHVRRAIITLSALAFHLFGPARLDAVVVSLTSTTPQTTSAPASPQFGITFATQTHTDALGETASEALKSFKVHHESSLKHQQTIANYPSTYSTNFNEWFQLGDGVHTYYVSAYGDSPAPYDRWVETYWQDEHDNPDDPDEITGGHWEPAHREVGFDWSYNATIGSQLIRFFIGNTQPVFSQHPWAAVGILGTSVVISASAGPNVSYHWQRLPAGGATWTNVSGWNYRATSTGDMATLRIVITHSSMLGDQFRCVATNAASSTASNPTAIELVRGAVDGRYVTLSYVTAQQQSTPGNPAFGIAINRGTYTDAEGNSATDWLLSYSVVSPEGLLATRSIPAGSESYTGPTYEDYRGFMTPGLYLYNVYARADHPEAFDLWVEGHYENVYDNPDDPEEVTDRRWVPAERRVGFEWFRNINFSSNSIPFYIGTPTATSGASPMFIRSPANAGPIVLGATAIFRSLAIADAVPIYRWQRLRRTGGSWEALADGPSYSGTATPVLTVTVTSADMAGDQFRCMASAVGTGYSDGATLTEVYTPPIFSLQPQDRTIAAGQTATLTVAASSHPSSSYAWQRLNGVWQGLGDDSGTSGANTPSLTVNYGGQFRCIAVNEAGMATSSVATVTFLASNQKPVAAFTITPTLGISPLSVSLNASASSDPDNAIVNYAWSFGASGSSPVATTAFSTGGNAPSTIPVTLTVSDIVGATGIATKDIVVYPVGTKTITVQDGASSASLVAPNGSVTITANPPPPLKAFIGWSIVSGGGVIAGPQSRVTTYIGAGADTVLKANYGDDIVPPSIPTQLRVGDIDAVSAAVKWNAATDDVGVVAYDIYDGELLLTSTSALSITLSDLEPARTYQIRVGARDAAGNRSEAAGPFIFKTWQRVLAASGTIATAGGSEIFQFSLPDAGAVKIYTRGATATTGSLAGPVYYGTIDGNGGNFVWNLPLPAGAYSITVAGRNAYTTGAFEVFADFGRAVQPDFRATPERGASPMLVSFDASRSFDPEGNAIVSYAWDFDGNGSTDATGPTASFTYGDGFYNARLTVTNSAGVSSSMRRRIITAMRDVYPVMGATANPKRARIGDFVTISAPSSQNGNPFHAWLWVAADPIYSPTAQQLVLPDNGFTTMQYWPAGQTPSPVTTLSVAAAGPRTNQAFAVSASSAHGTRPLQWIRIDYSADYGATWVEGTLAAGSKWQTSSAAVLNNTLTTTFSFGEPGLIIFRAVGAAEHVGVSASVHKFANITTAAENDTVTVIGGVGTPASGPAGTVVSLSPPPGIYLAWWELLSGSGSFANAHSPWTTFVKGEGPVIIRMNGGNPKPITVVNGIADRTLGGPGTEFKITANPAPAGFLFDRWVKTGSGVVLDVNAPATTYVMGDSGARLEATYRSTGTPSVSLAPSAYLVVTGKELKLTATGSDPNGDLKSLCIEYSPDDGKTWIAGTTSVQAPALDATRWEGTASIKTLTARFVLNFPYGQTVRFRARAGDHANLYSHYSQVEIFVCYDKPAVSLSALAAGVETIGSRDLGNAPTRTVVQGQPFTIRARGASGARALSMMRIDLSKDGEPWREGTESSQRLWLADRGGIEVHELEKTFELGLGTYRFRATCLDISQYAEYQYVTVIVSDAVPPSIARQPTDLVALVGQSAQFTVAASGPHLRYQWHWNGAELAGETGTTLSIHNLKPENSGGYKVAVSNELGTVASNAAQLVVNRPPTAAFVVSGATGSAPLSVTFNASSSSDPEGPIRSFEWEFGDGARATGMDAQHVYQCIGRPKAFKATLRVTDEHGATAMAEQSIQVSPDPESLADNDSDGIPDWWEMQWFQTLARNGLGDLDGDGLTDVAEYNLSWDPTSADTSAGVAVGNKLTSAWPGRSAGKTEAVGSTHGVLAVDPAGAASYSVPIYTPPGIAGVEPALALRYSSSGTNGLLGVGWALTGLSVITRGASSKELYLGNPGIESTTDPADGDGSDRFFMDGNRLHVVNGGVYGADASEYRTEKESFSKIVFHGGASPWFEVWAKSGLRLQYGNAETARAGPSGMPGVWLLNRVSDLNGNYMSITYSINETEKTHHPLPKRIDYTGRSNQAPFTSIRFKYNDRTDALRLKQPAVGSVDILHLLTDISVFHVEGAAETLVRSYSFGYKTSSYTGRSCLVSIQEAGIGGKLLPKTAFHWRTDDFSYEEVAATALSSAADLVFTGDFNGDGKSDYVKIGPKQSRFTRLYLSDGVGFTATGQSFALNDPNDFSNHEDNILVGDINGDGMTDLMGYFLKYGQPITSPNYSDHKARRKVWLASNVNGVVTFQNYNALAQAEETLQHLTNTTFRLPREFLVDIGREGRAKLLRVKSRDSIGPDGRFWRWDDSLSPPRLIEGPSALGLTAEDEIHLVETDGDGMTEFLTTNAAGVNGSTKVIGYNENGYFAGPTSVDFRYSTDKVYIGDFNGDGLSEALSIQKADNGTRRIHRYFGHSRQWSFEAIQATGSSDWHNQKILVADFNADGRDDLLVQRDQESQIWVSVGDPDAGAKFVLAHSIPRGPLKNEQAVPFDMNGDGRTDLFVRGDPAAGNNAVACRVLRAVGSSAPADVITGVTNGLGATDEITYSPLTDSSVYTKGGTATGMVDVQPSLFVVKSLKFDLGASSVDSGSGISDGGSASYSLTYRYEGLRAEPHRGVLGFAAQEVIDSRTQLITRIERIQSHPKTGFVRRNKIFRRQGTSEVVLADTDITPGQKTLHDGKTHFVYPAMSWTRTWAANLSATGVLSQGAETSSITTSRSFDDHGNLTSVEVDHGYDGRAVHTTTTYWPVDDTQWLLGRPKREVVTAYASGHSTDTRTTDIYFKDNDDLANEVVSPLLPTKRISEPSDPAKKLTAVIDYGAVGLVKKITLSGAKDATSAEQSRSVEYTYDSLNRFVRETKRTIGALELKSTTAPNQLYAAPASHTDENDNTTSFAYDEFGRLKSVTSPSNVTTETKLSWTTDPAGVFAAEVISTFNSGSKHAAPPTFSVFDRVGRPTRQGIVNADGHPVWTELRYDDRGMPAFVSQPWRQLPSDTDWKIAADYHEDGTPMIFWNRETFDVLGRPASRTHPNGTVTTHSYADRNTSIVTVSDTVTQKVRSVVDPLGRVVAIHRNEELGQAEERETLTYAYNASGRLATVVAAGRTTNTVYDNRGLPTSMTDPNAGLRTYQFNAFGELYQTKDAKNQETRFDYDVLGRLISRVQPEGTTTWTYDGATGKAKGLLQSVSGPDAMGGTAQESYEYDTTHTRLTKLTRTIAGTAFVTRPGYDVASRPLTVQYESPSVTQQFKYLYNDLGSLREIRDMSAGPTAGVAVWSLMQSNALGQPLAEILGNGLMTSSFYSMTDGALRDRISSAAAGFFEWQHYNIDGFGNVRQRQSRDAEGQPIRSESFHVDLLNRVTSVTLNGATMGSTTFDPQGNIASKSGVGSYAYLPGRPHAVSQAGETTYSYDENGNRTHRNGTDEAHREAWWTSFDQPWKLKRGGVESTFRYGVDGQRSQQASTSGETTYYVDGAHEYVTKAGVTEARFQVASPTGRLVQVTRGTTAGTKYFGADHLGSLQAITDHAGRTLETLSFDAWGQRRNADWTAGTPTRTTNINRGYTGHEMLDEQHLVHMNGRIYDPEIGRFLSVDPIVSAPTLAQTYNGYSYVANNPLSYVDPSGYEITLYSGFGGYNLSGLNVYGAGSGSRGWFSFQVAYGSWGGSYPISPAYLYTRVVGLGSPTGIAGSSVSAMSYLGVANGGAPGYSVVAGGIGIAPDTAAVANQRTVTRTDAYFHTALLVGHSVVHDRMFQLLFGRLVGVLSTPTLGVGAGGIEGTWGFIGSADSAGRRALSALGNSGHIGDKPPVNLIQRGASQSQPRINVGPAGHHVPAVRKSVGRPFEVGRADKSRPTMHSRSTDPGHDHWRMHEAERAHVGPRQGGFDGTDDQLFAAYRKAYDGLDDIRVDVQSPNGDHILGTNVSPREAVDLIEEWLRKQGLR